MIKPIMTFFLLLFALHSIAQTVECDFAKVDTSVLYSSNSAWLTNITAVSDSKLLWARIKNNKNTAGTTSYGDVEIAEYDTAMNKLTSIIVKGTVWSEYVVSDAAGNWYFTGRFKDTIAFPGQTPITRHPFSTSPDRFICRLAAGTLSLDWFIVPGAGFQGASTIAGGIALNNSKLYSWANWALDSATIYSIDMATGAMNIVLSQRNAGSIQSIVADSTGNLYVLGGCLGSSGPDTIYLGKHKEVVNILPGKFLHYLVRYRANGDFDWVNIMNKCAPGKLSYANDDIIYHSGRLVDSITLGGYFLKKPRQTDMNFFVASLDSNGKVRWAHSAGDDSGLISHGHKENAVASGNNIIVYLQMAGKIDWGNNITSDFRYKNNFRAVAVGYNVAGDVQWVLPVTSDYSASMNIVSRKNKIWISGMVRDSNFLKIDTFKIPTLQNKYIQFLAGSTVAFKYNPPPDTGDNQQSVAAVSRHEIQIYPNPATHILTIKLNSRPRPGSQLRLVNAIGVVVQRRNIDTVETEITLDVTTHARGLYFVELHTNEGKMVKKVLLR